MKSVLVIAIVCNFYSALGQTYIPMPIENGMNWRVHTATATMDYDDDETIVGDTTIGGLAYKKVRRYTTIFNSGSISYVIIRNDSINKRIYLRYNNVDTLLYDFNLNIGHTLHTYHLAHLKSAGMDTVRVATIDSIILNGVYHRKYNSTVIQSSPSYVYSITEGVGSEQGFIKNFTAFETGTWLLCQGKFGALSIYPDSSYYCDAPLLENNITFNPFTMIYPNPASHSISVHSDIPSFKILIYDIFGRILFKKLKYLEHTPIDISNWPNGVYFLSIDFPNRQSFNAKFIKE